MSDISLISILELLPLDQPMTPRMLILAICNAEGKHYEERRAALRDDPLARALGLIGLEPKP